MSQHSGMRIEEDMLGTLSFPVDAPYGIQTERARLNFSRKKQGSLGGYHSLVKGLLWVKQAAATANGICGYLSNIQWRAIVRAVEETLACNLEEMFPVHRLHGGGGTSANMNANEVVARKVQQYFKKEGFDEPFTPCGHVNLHQSTNDVYPTACHIAIILDWKTLDDALCRLELAFRDLTTQYAHVDHLARTCLQDAVVISSRDFFSGYESMVGRQKRRLAENVDRLHHVNLGGTIVGDTKAVPSDYFHAVLPALREISGDPGFERHANLFDAAQNPDDMLAVASGLDDLARCLIKVGKDFRLLASGPEAGFNELILPAVQPGSTAMPGKVNPVMPEFLIQSCMDAIGHCHAARMGLDHGELDLNIWESLIVCSILDAMDLLEQAIISFENKCLAGIEINASSLEKHCQCTTALVERLSREHGYDYVTRLCSRARMEKRSVMSILQEEGLL